MPSSSSLWVSCFPFKSVYISGGGRAGSANENKDIMYYCLIVDLPMVSLCRVKSKEWGQDCFFSFFLLFSLCSNPIPKVFPECSSICPQYHHTFIRYALAEYEPSFIYINYKPGALCFWSGVCAKCYRKKLWSISRVSMNICTPLSVWT